METWKPIKGFEGLYEVSNLGRVKSLERVVVRSWSPIPYKVKGKIKKAAINGQGYFVVSLLNKNKSKVAYIHKLLTEAFLPNPDNHKVINHKNGIKTDNRLDNLEWCTSSHNNQHALDNRLRTPAKSCIDEGIALQIWEMRKQRFKVPEISKVVGISEYSIKTFLRGKSYKYLQSLNISNQ